MNVIGRTWPGSEDVTPHPPPVLVELRGAVRAASAPPSLSTAFNRAHSARAHPYRVVRPRPTHASRRWRAPQTASGLPQPAGTSLRPGPPPRRSWRRPSRMSGWTNARRFIVAGGRPRGAPVQTEDPVEGRGRVEPESRDGSRCRGWDRRAVAHSEREAPERGRSGFGRRTASNAEAIQRGDPEDVVKDAFQALLATS